MRIDSIGFGDMRLKQNPDDFCYGIDAVLLADFAKLSSSDTVCDLGSGNGIVPLIINHKYSPVKITGLEFQSEPYKLAVENAALNNLENKICFVNADVLDVKTIFEPESFTAVTSNPPYTEKGTGPVGANPVKHAARHETTADLKDFISAASYLLCKGGSFTIVHRPSRLVDIFTYCREFGMEPKKLRFVAPYENREPNIVLVQCIKGGGKELKTEPTLIVRTSAGDYTSDIDKIYERI